MKVMRPLAWGPWPLEMACNTWLCSAGVRLPKRCKPTKASSCWALHGLVSCAELANRHSRTTVRFAASVAQKTL